MKELFNSAKELMEALEENIDTRKRVTETLKKVVLLVAGESR